MIRHVLHSRDDEVVVREQRQSLAFHDASALETGHGISPPEQFETAVVVFHQSAATLHPISAVAIDDVVQLDDLGAMNVPADYPVDAESGGLVRHRFLEVADELDRVLDLMLQKSRQGPVREVESASYAVDEIIRFEQPVIQPGSHYRNRS